MISNQYPELLIAAPLLASFIVVALGWLDRRIAYYLAVASMVVSSASSILLLLKVVETGPVLYKLGGWDPPMGIAYYVDGLNGLVLAAISVVALINLIATKANVRKEHPGKGFAFYGLYLLSVCGHLGIVVTGDAFNLYVLLEIAALSGYALLAMGNKRAPHAVFNYLLIGTIGASFYLLGVGFLYIHTGSLNMLDLAGILTNLGPSVVVYGAFGFILTGIMLKCAMFPLHAWLPNAYANAPSAAAGLIAPMTTKVMIYVLIRMILTVFTPDIAFSVEGFSQAMVWLASAGIVAGGLFALSSRNLKYMLTFILISEVGYMFGGAWLGNRLGMTGSILHIINDAFMTLVMFMAAGSMTYKLKDLEFKNLQGLFTKMPFTMAAFVLGAAAMIGVPPTCGFFSKWYLVLGGIEAGQYQFVAALILSSLFNVILFFRIFEIAFFEPEEHGHHEHAPVTALAEGPVLLIVPLYVATAGLIGLGLFTADIVGVIDTVIPTSIM